jgi:2-polyprenyl-6-methoxyphenol hydroxylase-like FAD-dependent oxidoreductase
MLINNQSIAIVGGGPGGLTLARLLQLKGADVKVFERDLNKNARVQGAPLDLHDDSGLAAIRKADLLEEFKQNYLVGADRELIMNENAEIFSAITRNLRKISDTCISARKSTVEH